MTNDPKRLLGGGAHIFCFQDMETFGYKAYWVSLKLRTRRQKDVFSFVFDHPNCVLGEIREGLNLTKDNILPVLRGLNDRGVLITEENSNRRIRHYSINYEVVDQFVESFRQRIYRMFPEAMMYEEIKDELKAAERAEEEEKKARLEKKMKEMMEKQQANPENKSDPDKKSDQDAPKKD